MSVEATEPAGATAIDSTPAPAGSGFLHRLLMALGPILAALVLAGAILVAVGVDPLAYYGTVLQRGLLSPLGIQQTLTRMAPLLFIAAGLIVAFRAGMWNLGGDGQFLLGAVTAAASAPLLVAVMPGWLALLIAFLLATAVAMIWSLVPALLRAYQGVNEIITTLMMTFLGTSLANVVRVLFFLTDIAEFYPVYKVWERRLGGRPLPFSAVEVPAPLPVPGATVMTEAWVYAP